MLRGSDWDVPGVLRMHSMTPLDCRAERYSNYSPLIVPANPLFQNEPATLV